MNPTRGRLCYPFVQPFDHIDQQLALAHKDANPVVPWLQIGCQDLVDAPCVVIRTWVLYRALGVFEASVLIRVNTVEPNVLPRRSLPAVDVHVCTRGPPQIAHDGRLAHDGEVNPGMNFVGIERPVPTWIRIIGVPEVAIVVPRATGSYCIIEANNVGVVVIDLKVNAIGGESRAYGSVQRPTPIHQCQRPSGCLLRGRFHEVGSLFA